LILIIGMPTRSRLRSDGIGLCTSLPGFFTHTIVPHIWVPQGKMRTRVSPLWLSQVPTALAPRAGCAIADCTVAAATRAAAPYAFTLMTSLQNRERATVTLKLAATKACRGQRRGRPSAGGKH